MTHCAALYEVLYVSTLAPLHPPTVVAEIAARARHVNAELDVTGLLIFDGQRFCQQLEGPQKSVLKLIERIRNDPRHINVEVLHHGRWRGGGFSSSPWRSAPWRTWTPWPAWSNWTEKPHWPRLRPRAEMPCAKAMRIQTVRNN